MDVKLSRPFKVGELEERAFISLAFEKLTGSDVIFCEREATAARGQQILGALVLDTGFHVQVAARASGLDVELLKKLPAVDFMAVLTATQNFLLGSD